MIGPEFDLRPPKPGGRCGPTGLTGRPYWTDANVAEAAGAIASIDADAYGVVSHGAPPGWPGKDATDSVYVAFDAERRTLQFTDDVGRATHFHGDGWWPRAVRQLVEAGCCQCFVVEIWTGHGEGAELVGFLDTSAEELN
jgi:hypothetical protein